jgi:signal transduction histidine kinase
MSAAETLNILLVDDQPGKLLTYETMLAGLGENLIKAHTARDALSYLLKDDIAVVLMDVNMPELDGFELAAMIREHPRCQRTTIIFVSAIHLTDFDRVRGYQTGAVDYVSVPVVPEILRAKVSVFLDLYRKTNQLERLNHELEERVSARTAELEASVARLQESESRLRTQGEALAEADRRKDEFLAMLAHELRNPLHPIRNAVEMLRHPAASADSHAWARDVIDRQVRQLVRLVDDLLDANRISHGKLELRKEIVELNQIVADAVESCRPLVESYEHELMVDVPSAPIYLEADAIRLTQVLLNLLNNGCKFTPRGGRIELSVASSNADVVLSIKDSGTGISPYDLPRVFDMFYQGKSRGSDAQGGLGLGLTLVRRLVEMHGGTVRAHSDGRTKGSEFTVVLPTLAGQLSPAARDAPVVSASRQAVHRILVVDDNRDAAESLAEILRLVGNDVATAFDGAAAVSAAEQFEPDVVLLDLGMPTLDGYAAARAIRNGAAGTRMTLIAVTGWGRDTDRQRTHEAGFDQHLVKPVDPAALLAYLSSLGRSAQAADTSLPPS